MSLRASDLRGLYVITDPHWTPTASLLNQVEAALRGGAQLVQYRDKYSTATERYTLARSLLTLCQQYDRLLIINDDVELCAEIGAHGVHLGQADTAISDARHRLGAQAIIGATCHNNLSAAQQASRQGASYVAFGRFFASRTKPQAPPASLNELLPGLAALDIPAVAIGGITLARAAPFIAAGFAMLAVIQDVFARDDIQAHCARYAALFK
jgi:thiamine-phosphate pyrophosphorylase